MQIAQKRSKTCGKRVKTKTPKWVFSQKPKKWRIGERVVAAHEGEDLKRGHINYATPIYKNATQGCKFTKLPFCHSELQKMPL